MTNTATVEMIKNIINGVTPLHSKALSSAFPVGRVYISVDEVSPASLFGGTWEKIEKKFLYGTGGGTPLGSTGGEAEHTLTIAEMPSHSHQQGYTQDSYEGWANTVKASPGLNLPQSLSYDMTSIAGGSQPHNNMPPFIAVNIWKRIA